MVLSAAPSHARNQVVQRTINHTLIDTNTVDYDPCNATMYHATHVCNI